jgi:tetratricopeptide (TPR) repeat protein
VWAVAFCLRCLYLWQIHHAPFFDLRIGDAEAYHLWARRIAGGDWVGQGVFYQAPLYPYFLAVVYRVFGDSLTVVRLIQAGIGAASCALIAAAGMALFGRAGAIAGLGLAIYPSAIFLDGLADKSSLVTFFTAALLALLALSPKRAARPMRRWLGAGAILGLLALTRENALVLAVPVLLWIVLGSDPRGGVGSDPRGAVGSDPRAVGSDPQVAAGSDPRGVGSDPKGAGVRPHQPHQKPPTALTSALAFAAGWALVLVPVGVRNYAAGGEFHLTTSQFGPNFYIGNHPGAKGTYEALVVGHGSAADERQDATRLAEQTAGRKLSAKEVSWFWTTRSLDYIRAQPIDWLELMARKLALTLNAAEISDTESQDVYAEWSWLVRALRPLDFGVLFGLAMLGTVLTARSWRRIWFLHAIATTYALSVVIFYVFARYRFPVVPVLMILAAGGLIEVRAALKRRDAAGRRRARTLAVAAVAAAAAIAFAHLPLENAREARATHYLDLATALSKDVTRRGSPDARGDLALSYYKRALDEAPGFPGASFGLATHLARMGRPAEAIPYYRAALEGWPDHAEARYNFGLALAATGQPQDASDQYVEALRLRPDDADTHIALARTYVALRRPALAAEQYEQALTIQPKHVKALIGWGVALTQLGRAEEAIAKYRLALELDPREPDAHNNLGWTLATQGRIAEAIPHFERALALNPGDENARMNLERARQVSK